MYLLRYDLFIGFIQLNHSFLFYRSFWHVESLVIPWSNDVYILVIIKRMTVSLSIFVSVVRINLPLFLGCLSPFY